MFNNRSTALAFAALFFSSFVPGLAQESSSVSLQFLAFPKQIRPEPVELVVGENKTIRVKTPGNELSPSYELSRGMGAIVLGETIKDAKGEEQFQVYGRANLLNASQQIILLLRKGKKNSDGFVILPLDGELANFSGGSYLFINASKMTVAGKIGDQRFQLNPGQRKMLQPGATHDGGGCQLTLAYQREEDWKIFKDTRWSTSKRYRSLVFFHQDPSSGRIQVSPIVDMLPFSTPNTG